jgi:hypothetical protein
MDIEEWQSLLMLTSIGKYVRWVKYPMGIWTIYTQSRRYHEYVSSSSVPVPLLFVHLVTQPHLPPDPVSSPSTLNPELSLG